MFSFESVAVIHPGCTALGLSPKRCACSPRPPHRGCLRHSSKVSAFVYQPGRISRCCPSRMSRSICNTKGTASCGSFGHVFHVRNSRICTSDTSLSIHKHRNRACSVSFRHQPVVKQVGIVNGGSMIHRNRSKPVRSGEPSAVLF